MFTSKEVHNHLLQLSKNSTEEFPAIHLTIIMTDLGIEEGMLIPILYDLNVLGKIHFTEGDQFVQLSFSGLYSRPGEE